MSIKVNPREKEMRQLLERLEEVEMRNGHIDRLVRHLEHSRFIDVLQNYNNPRRVLGINFLAGLGRGLGLTVGTALFLGFLALLLGKFISLPIIGEYIARLLDMVDTYRQGSLLPK